MSRFRLTRAAANDLAAIDITSQQHQSLKALTALQGKSIKQYVLERLSPDDANGNQAWRKLRILLGERIEQGLAGQISTKSIDVITEDELGPNRDS